MAIDREYAEIGASSSGLIRDQGARDVDPLQTAYELVKQHKGGPGLRGLTFEKIEQQTGKQEYLLALQEINHR